MRAEEFEIKTRINLANSFELIGEFDPETPKIEQLPYISESYAIGYRLMELQNTLDRLDKIICDLDEILAKSQPVFFYTGCIRIFYEKQVGEFGYTLRPYPRKNKSLAPGLVKYERIPFAKLQRRAPMTNDFAHNYQATYLTLELINKILKRRAKIQAEIGKFKMMCVNLGNGIDELEIDVASFIKEQLEFIEPIPKQPIKGL